VPESSSNFQCATRLEVISAFFASSANYIELKRETSGRLLVSSKIDGSSGWAPFTDPASYINDNEWHHVAIVMNLSTFDYYVDGVYSNSRAVPRVSGLVGNPYFAIATRRDWGQYPLMGAMDDVRLYNRMLTADDIAELLTVAQYPPIVDAGPLQSLLWPGSAVTLQMNATATDDGNPDPPGALTYIWSQISGPTVTFAEPCNVEDAFVTFPSVGFYELKLNVSDGQKSTEDTVRVNIRATNDPIAYWDFDEGTGLTVDDDSANNNEGTLAGDLEPNWVSGWVNSNDALEFFGVAATTVSSYVDITSDPAAADPNLDTLKYEVSLSAWFKIDDLANTYHPAIIASSDKGWRLYVESDGDKAGWLTFTPGDSIAAAAARVYSGRSVADGCWHHAVGAYDGSTSYLYLDGQLSASAPNTGSNDLLDVTDGVPVIIGGRCKIDDMSVERSWNGLIDDVRVHSYALSAAHVADLADDAALIPIVDAGGDQEFWLKDGSLVLDATVIDDAKPAAATLVWTQTSGPEGGVATFDPCDIEDPYVTFSLPGQYVLRLTADDGLKAVYDYAAINVISPTCEDIISDGLLIKSDISGPADAPDCYIDLYDFAAFAGDWLRCNNPEDVDCEYVY